MPSATGWGIRFCRSPGRSFKKPWFLRKLWPGWGYEILKSVEEYAGLAEYVLYHHERWDGRGYPEGLQGEEIPRVSRIICVADAYEAMTAARPYQKARSREEAMEEMERCAGTQFDPHLVSVFLGKVLQKASG
jgi:HD-GYP domain-containing protein (c-di-GMP phosphodiesterase class II)